MPTFDDSFDSVRTTSLERFGPAVAQFEGLGRFESMVAVLLDRAVGATRWRAALDGLRTGELLTPERMAEAEFPELTDALVENGVSASAKSIAPLKHLARWSADINADLLDAGDLPSSSSLLREELSAIKGVGQAAADAIILYALGRPSYPVDRATFRVLVRHGWLDSSATYEEARDLIVERVMRFSAEREDEAARVLGDLAHGMVQLGRQYCRAAAPRCDQCPLEHLLPEGGPREVDA